LESLQNKAGLVNDMTDEWADAAIEEIYIRAGQRRPTTRDGFRWADEGPRRVRDLDTVRRWIAAPDDL
jgi:hypothetical protein